MAGIPTLSIKTTVTTIRDQYRHTAARLKKHRLTSALAAELAAIEPDLVATAAEEERLLVQEQDAAAAVEFLDDELDAIVDEVVSALGNNRNSPKFRELFGSQRPSEFKRPVLGDQLGSMMNWPALLEGSTNAILAAAHTKLVTLLPQAAAAREEQSAVAARLKMFRETGMRAKLVDKLNALRKSIYGKLGQLQHDPANGLPVGWAESFFRQVNTGEALTVRELDRRIAAGEEQVAAWKQRRADLIARDELQARARAETERRARQAQLAAKQQAIAALSAQVAELKTALEDTDPGSPMDPIDEKDD